MQSMNAPAISTINLTKRFGKLTALKNVHMNIAENARCALVGKPDSGKTVFTLICSTLMLPTWGEIRIAGRIVGYESQKIRRIVGLCPQYVTVYEDLTVGEDLCMFAGLRGVDASRLEQLTKDLVDLVDLRAVLSTPTVALDRVAQRQLAIARSLVQEVRVLFLDAPCDGLNASDLERLDSTFAHLGELKATIVVTSQTLAAVAKFCDSVAVLEAGELLFHGSVTDYESQHSSATGSAV